MSDLAALIAAIDENPDDDARYLVLADALIAAGDPRGELITLQAELAKRPHDRELAIAETTAKATAWGDLAPYRRYVRKSRWRLGFLDEVDVHPHATLEVVDALAKSPVARWLRSLIWVSSHVTQAHLASLRNLRTLEVGSAVDAASFHALAALPRVEALEVHGSLTPEAIAKAPGALRSLHLAYMKPFTDEHVAATAKLRTLRELTLRNTFTFSDAAFERLGETVRSLSVRVCNTTSAIFKHLARRRLSSLQLNPRNHGVDGAELARLPATLEQLKLYSVSNPEKLLAALGAHRTLVEAELGCAFDDRSPVEAETLGRVLALPALTRFGIRFPGEITGDELPETQLTALNLHVGGVSPAFAAALAQLPLVELHLVGSDKHNEWVDDAYIARLADNAALEHLDLSQTAITDAGLRALHGLPLAKLELANCRGVTARGLAKLIATLPAIRELDLSSNDVDVTVLAAAASRPGLRVLNVRGAKLADADLAALLPAAPTLRDLELTSTGIRIAAVPHLAQLHALDRIGLGLEHEIAGALRPLLPHCFVDV